MNAPVRRWRGDLLVIAFYLVLAIASTYPLLFHLTTHVPGRGTDDPALTWNLWWMKYALFDAPSTPLYSNTIYYPIGVNLVAYTSTFLNAVLALPLQFDFGVIVAQNLYTWSALVISGYGAFLLSREMLSRLNPQAAPASPPPSWFLRHRSDLAAFVAGAFYGFGAWHISYVAAGHFMLLSNQWIPFLALMLLRLDRTTARLRDGILAGLFFVMCAWTELTFLPIITLFTVFFLIYLMLVYRRAWKKIAPNVRSLLNHNLLTNFAAFILVVAIGVAPLALNLLLDTLHYGYYLAPGLGRVQIFSAEPISYFLPSFEHPILGAWANAITTANTSYAFIGWAALALAILGFIAAWRLPEARFWGILAVFFALVLLGATLIIGGKDTGIPMPFALLRLLPFVNANRYPVRFNVMLMLALTPLMAWGVWWLLAQRRGVPILIILCAVLVFEQLVLPIPLSDLTAGNVFQAIRVEPGDFTVMDLPLGWRNSVVIQGDIDFKAQFLQTIHEKRLLGGLTSRNPLFKYQYFREIPFLNSIILLEEGATVDSAQRDRDRAVAQNIVQFFDIRYIEAQRQLTSPAVLEYVRSLLPLTEIGGDAERVVYRVDVPPLPTDATIDPTADTSRMLFDDMWGRPQEEAADALRWATDGTARLWLPLANHAYDFTFHLRGALPNQAVALRVNGQNVAQWTLGTTWGDYNAHIPVDVLHSGLAEFVFSSDTTPLAQAAPDDRTIGSTDVVSPVDISAVSAGFNAGKFGEIIVGGHSVSLGPRGYQLVAVNPQSGAVDAVGSFDTFADKDASQNLNVFVSNLPAGEIVVGVTIDEASQSLTKQGVSALQQLGVSTDLRGHFRAGHAFVSIKGIAPGKAVEDVNLNFPANVAVGKNVNKGQVSFALGPFSYVQTK